MKVAIVHDQLQEFGGAERVLVSLKKIFPQADVFTSFYNPHILGHHRELFKSWNIITSWADKIPFLKRIYSPLRFITPFIWESFNVREYDLVISSSGSYMSKGIITRPETLHICYLHHPPRYLYYYETAIEWQKYALIRMYGNLINHNMRMWDYLSSQRVDYFIANSQETKKRIQKFYHRDAEVVYPPVSIPQNHPHHTQHTTNYYITVSRLAKAKHIDVLIQAANTYGFRLRIIGIGRDEKHLKSIAGSTVEFLGSLSDYNLATVYKNAKAFLFASVDEEFGIAPVEAMGYGMPVIAYKSGGLMETVKDGVNGYLFEHNTPNSLIQKIKLLESLSPKDYLEMKKQARKTAEQFSEQRFQKEIFNFISKHSSL